MMLGRSKEEIMPKFKKISAGILSADKAFAEYL